MALLLTAELYTATTGDPAGDTFDVDEARAVRRLEAALRRPLVQATATVSLVGYADGWAYPSLLPVVSASQDGVELDVEPGRVRCGKGTQVVELVSGFTTASLPIDLADAIAWAIHTLRHPASTGIAPGLSSLNVAGEFSVTVAAGVSLGADGLPLPKALSHASELGGRACSLAVRYRRAGGVA